MGCDYSKRTKQEFDDKTEEINASIKSMSKIQQNLKAKIEELHIPKEPIESIEDMRRSLLPHLEKIEALLIEIKNAKEESNSAERPRISVEIPGKNKFQISTKAESCDPLSRGESPYIKKEKEVQSILDDPAIKAMIEKNRQKFVAKKSK